MRRPSALLVVEVLALVAWVALAATLVVQARWQGELTAIDPDAIASGVAEETWMGIYFQDQKVGYAVSSQAPTTEGGQLYRNRSAFEFVGFGEINRVVTLSNAVTGPTGELRQFEFFMSSDPVRINARGEVRPGELYIEIVQGGELQSLTVPIEQPPQISASLGGVFAQQELISVGDVYRVPYFDPASLSQSEMEMRVVDLEVLANGEEAYWVERQYGDIVTRVLVTPSGRTLREENGTLGMALVAETPEEAQKMPAGVEPVDLISLSAAELQGGKLPDPRATRMLQVAVFGVEPERVPDAPPYQRRVEERITIERVPLDRLPQGMPRAEVDPAFVDYLGSTPFMPVEHREIQAKAQDVIGELDDRAQAAEALVDWVYGYLIKSPTIGVPNALEILRVGEGDCNEHTSLYVALARAAGMPARIAAGLVYSDRISGQGGFYYHAWPEVWMGEDAGWVPVDPTFGQFPADATHIKLVEGDLDRQVEIMGVMGRIGFRLIESE